MMRTEVVIIGAGFAGLAAARALLRQGVKSLVVLEREAQPGQHASSQNAGMIRQSGVAEDIQEVLVAGARALREVFPSRSELFREQGALLLMGKNDHDRTASYLEGAKRWGLPVELHSREAAVRRVPILAEADFDSALWSPQDGVLDIHALLSYLTAEVKNGGGFLQTGLAVTGFERSGDRLVKVNTATGAIETSAVVNAAGAWAASIAVMAGASPIRFHPYRRHLAFTGPLAWVKADWPFVWDIHHEYYFRPETGGLLMSPCDETRVPAGRPQVDDGVMAEFGERLSRVCPPLAGLPVQRAWAGLRTFAEDRKFVVGPDPRVKNFFWLAGLGGHGVTGCLALGELAARSVLGRTEGEELASWRPERFQGAGAGR